MKFKNTMMITVVQLALISSAANANVIFQSASTGQDYCNTVPGKWHGSGSVSKGSLKCNYTGDAIVSATADPTQFLMDISLHRSSGSKLCPENESFQLPSTCINNTITVKDDDADLTGILSNNGNSADFKGTVTIPEVGSVKVDYMHLDKQ